MVLPVYKAVLVEDVEEQGVSVISLVTNPAIESNFVAYNKEEYKEQYNLVSFNEEKRMVTGAVMIPDRLLLRNFDGMYCYAKFDEPTIRACHKRMMKSGNFGRFSLFHDNVELNTISPMEIWIKESENDKSSNYGFSELPNGTLFLTAHIEDDDTWDMVKNGIINGFSIESILNYELTPMRKVVYQALEVGSKVIIQEGENIQFNFSGEEICEDGKKVIIADGVITEIKETAESKNDDEDEKDKDKENGSKTTPDLDALVSKIEDQAKEISEIKESMTEVMSAMTIVTNAITTQSEKYSEILLAAKQGGSTVENENEGKTPVNVVSEESSNYARLKMFNEKFNK